MWDIAGCCPDGGEGSLGFFFGDDNLFDLGEIEATLAYPVIEEFTISLSCRFAMAGGHAASFGWEMKI